MSPSNARRNAWADLLEEPGRRKVVQAQSENVEPAPALTARHRADRESRSTRIVSSAQFKAASIWWAITEIGRPRPQVAEKVLALARRNARSTQRRPARRRPQSFIDVAHRKPALQAPGHSRDHRTPLDPSTWTATNFGKNAHRETLNLDFHGAAPAVGRHVQINVRDQEGNLYALHHDGGRRVRTSNSQRDSTRPPIRPTASRQSSPS